MPASVEVPVRITVVGPPPGVPFAVQRGRDELLPPDAAAADVIGFRFSLRATRRADGAPSFGGPFAQGPAHDRFVYVTCGRRAGDAESPWDRRAKVRLGGIAWETVEQVLATPGAALVASIPGLARDGGPVCASVALLGGGWRVEAEATRCA
jgi:hypothetical protein